MVHVEIEVIRVFQVTLHEISSDLTLGLLLRIQMDIALGLHPNEIFARNWLAHCPPIQLFRDQIDDVGCGFAPLIYGHIYRLWA